jgi:putative chitinase
VNVLPLQQALKSHGADPGALDGSWGAKTCAALLTYAAGRPLGDLGIRLATAMVIQFPKFEIDTRLQIIHFIAQACHETGAFHYMTEIGGPTYFTKYDGRADLGNTQPGDGFRFRGRGIFQLTGRANYLKFGKVIGVDLIANPEAAAAPENAVVLACLYWANRHINDLADKNDVVAVTKAINGGRNGLDERTAITNRMLAIWTATA